MERFVEVPGGRLFTVDEGEGSPVVLLHAGIADLRAWDAMVPGLTAAGFRAVRYDGRGFGRTETAHVEFSNRADAVAVLDALGIGTAALVGNSRGGQIAIDTAIEYPDRVVAVVAVGAGLGGYEGPLSADEQALFDEGDRLEAATPVDVDAITELLLRVWVDGPGQRPDRVPSPVRDRMAEMIRGVYDPPRAHGRPIVLDPPANERLADLRCPVLAVAGGLDVWGVAATARRLADGTPEGRAAILPDVAHMIGVEAPDRLTALIVEFLGPLRPWA